MTPHNLSEILIIVLPIALALLALAVAWGAALTRQKTMNKDIVELETKMGESEDVLKNEYLTIEGHRMMCENTALRFEKKVTKEIKSMGDTLVLKIEAIINGGR